MGWLLLAGVGLLVLRPTRQALASALASLARTLLELMCAPLTIALVGGWLLVRAPAPVWPWKLAGLAGLAWWLHRRAQRPTARPDGPPPTLHGGPYPVGPYGGWDDTEVIDAELVDDDPAPAPPARPRPSRPAAPPRGTSVAAGPPSIADQPATPAGAGGGSGWWQVAATAVWPDCTRELTAEFPLGPTPPTPQALGEIEQRLTAWANVQIPGCSYATVTGWWPLPDAPAGRWSS